MSLILSHHNPDRQGETDHAGGLENTRDTQRAQESIRHLESLVKAEPGNVAAWCQLGLAQKNAGNMNAAHVAYQIAVQCQPDNRDARWGLAGIYRYAGLVSEARQQLEALLPHYPGCRITLNNLATLLQDQGEPEQALQRLRVALEHNPDALETHSNYLIGLQYLPRVTPAQLQAAARGWGNKVMARQSICPARPRPGDASHDQATHPLRIGYVSGDFRDHPVGWLIKPVIENHDANRVLPYVYDNGITPDALTAALQAAVARFHADGNGWRAIGRLTDDEVCRLIQQDAIDILVDLSGHTAKSRLPLFARCVAPLHISWLGYFATTGLPTIDHVILDP